MRRVELRTYQKVKDGHEKDYCVKDRLIGAVVITHGGYNNLSAKARKVSMHLGEEIVDGFHYIETEKREKGLGAVCVVISEFTKEKVTEKREFYEDGRHVKTVVNVWQSGGIHKQYTFLSNKER